MEEKDIIAAIRYLKPESEFSFSNNDYATIKWDVLDGDAPTWAEIKSAHLQLKNNEQEANAAAANKREAALVKLAALGLEPDDLKALGL